MGNFGKWVPKSVVLGLVTLASALAAGTATAQQYPTRTINIVTSVTAGSPFDLLARVFTERMRQKLGVPVILENVTGGQGLIATQRVLNAKSDGYTLTIGSAGIPTAPIVVKNAGYKAEDFIPIAPLGQVPYILFVSSAVPSTDIDSFMTYLKGYYHQGQTRYSGIWRGGIPDRKVRNDVRETGLNTLLTGQRQGGHLLQSVSGYQMDGDVAYAAIWQA